MKTHIPIFVVWLGEFILVADEGLSQDDSFHKNIIYFVFEGLQVESSSLNVFENRSHRPFVPRCHVLGTRVVHIFWVFLVYGIVG